MTIEGVGAGAAVKREAEHAGDEEGRVEMARLPRISPIRPSHSGLYDPQPNDVPVTVVTALILLLVLCVVALL